MTQQSRQLRVACDSAAMMQPTSEKGYVVCISFQPAAISNSTDALLFAMTQHEVPANIWTRGHYCSSKLRQESHHRRCNFTLSHTKYGRGTAPRRWVDRCAAAAGSQSQPLSPQPKTNLVDNAVFGSPTPTPSPQAGKMLPLGSEHSLLSPGSSPEQRPQQQLVSPANSSPLLVQNLVDQAIQCTFPSPSCMQVVSCMQSLTA